MPGRAAAAARVCLRARHNPEPAPTYEQLVAERKATLREGALPRERILELFQRR